MSDEIKFDDLGFEATVLAVLTQAERHCGQRVYISIYDLSL